MHVRAARPMRARALLEEDGRSSERERVPTPEPAAPSSDRARARARDDRERRGRARASRRGDRNEPERRRRPKRRRYVAWAIPWRAPLLGLGPAADAPSRPPRRRRSRAPRSCLDACPTRSGMPESPVQREVGVVVPHGRGQRDRAGVRQHAAEPRARARRTAACCSRGSLRAMRRAGPVLFDEYHLGVGERRSMMRYLRQAGAMPLVLQLLLVALLLLWRARRALRRRARAGEAAPAGDGVVRGGARRAVRAHAAIRAARARAARAAGARPDRARTTTCRRCRRASSPPSSTRAGATDAAAALRRARERRRRAGASRASPPEPRARRARRRAPARVESDCHARRNALASRARMEEQLRQLQRDQERDPRRGRARDRRPGRGDRAAARRAPRAGPRAARGRARHGEDADGAQPVARCSGSQFGRIQFTPDLMPSDILGTHVFDAAERARSGSRKGPDLHRAAARRRDQPRAGEDAERAARGDAGAPGLDRRPAPPARASSSPCSRRRTRSSTRAPIRCPRRSSIASCSRSQVGYPSAEEEDAVLARVERRRRHERSVARRSCARCSAREHIQAARALAAHVHGRRQACAATCAT